MRQQQDSTFHKRQCCGCAFAHCSMHCTAIRHIQTQNGTRRRELPPVLKPAIRDEVAGAKATLRAAKFGDSALSSWADMSDRAVMKNLFGNNSLAVGVRREARRAFRAAREHISASKMFEETLRLPVTPGGAFEGVGGPDRLRFPRRQK